MNIPKSIVRIFIIIPNDQIHLAQRDLDLWLANLLTAGADGCTGKVACEKFKIGKNKVENMVHYDVFFKTAKIRWNQS